MVKAGNSDEDLMGYITVMPINKSKFKFAFRSTTTSTELVKLVCERAGVKQPQFFGLKRMRNLRSEFDGDGMPKVWMSENIPLFTHGCDSSTVLHLRHKYWFYDVEEIADPGTLQLIWEETDIKLMRGQFEVSEDAIIQLAACKVQLLVGDFDKNKPVSEEHMPLLIPEYIRAVHTNEDWLKLIGVFHEKLKGVNKEGVQKKYLVLAKEYGGAIQTTFFPAQYSTRDMKSKVKILVGVSPDGVGFYSFSKERRKLQVFHHFREIQSCVINPLWNGLEAPDFDRRLPGTLAFETDPYVIGPFRSQLFLKSKHKRTKDLEIEISSFLSDDDSIMSFIDTYNNNLKQYITIMSLDEQTRDTFIQISTLDGLSKRVRLTSDMTGQELIAIFAQKIGMTDTAFFQLSAVTDGCDKWVAFKESVMGQGISEATPLTLKLRFSWLNPVDIKDPVTRTLYYVQNKAAILNGDIPVTEADALELAGLSLQYTYGTYDKKRNLGFGRSGALKSFIPFYLLEFHGSSWWEKKIMSSHEKCSKLSQEEALAKYLAILGGLPNYGISYFQGIIPRTEEECYVGIGKQGVALFKHENMDLIISYRFGYELRRYTNDGEAIELHVRPTRHAEERIVVIVSLQFNEIIESLSYYEKMRQRERQPDKSTGEVLNFD